MEKVLPLELKLGIISCLPDHQLLPLTKQVDLLSWSFWKNRSQAPGWYFDLVKDGTGRDRYVEVETQYELNINSKELYSQEDIYNLAVTNNKLELVTEIRSSITEELTERFFRRISRGDLKGRPELIRICNRLGHYHQWKTTRKPYKHIQMGQWKKVAKFLKIVDPKRLEKVLIYLIYTRNDNAFELVKQNISHLECDAKFTLLRAAAQIGNKDKFLFIAGRIHNIRSIFRQLYIYNPTIQDFQKIIGNLHNEIFEMRIDGYRLVYDAYAGANPEIIDIIEDWDLEVWGKGNLPNITKLDALVVGRSRFMSDPSNAYLIAQRCQYKFNLDIRLVGIMGVELLELWSKQLSIHSIPQTDLPLTNKVASWISKFDLLSHQSNDKNTYPQALVFSSSLGTLQRS